MCFPLPQQTGASRVKTAKSLDSPTFGRTSVLGLSAYVGNLDVSLLRAYYDVVRACIEEFWPRLTPGGLLVLDNLNHETAPGETQAVRELLPNSRIRSFGFAFQPTGYITKE